MLKFSVFLTILTLFALNSTSSFAQTSFNSTALTVSPGIFEKILDKGESSEQEIVVINQLEQPMPINVSTGNFELNEKLIDTGIENTNRFNADSWIEINENNFILEPKASKIVKIKIVVPNDAEHGGKYASIYFNPVVSDTLRENSGAMQSARVAVLAFLVIKGDLIYKINLSNFNLPIINFSSSQDINFNIENYGNVHVMPNINLHSTNLITRTTQQITMNPFIVLPNTNRIIKAEYKNNIGLYKLILEAKYGPHKETIKLSKYSLFFNIYTFLALLLLLTLIYLFFIIKSKRLKKALKVLFSKNI